MLELLQWCRKLDSFPSWLMKYLASMVRICHYIIVLSLRNVIYERNTSDLWSCKGKSSRYNWCYCQQLGWNGTIFEWTVRPRVWRSMREVRSSKTDSRMQPKVLYTHCFFVLSYKCVKNAADHLKDLTLWIKASVKQDWLLSTVYQNSFQTASSRTPLLMDGMVLLLSSVLNVHE